MIVRWEYCEANTEEWHRFGQHGWELVAVCIVRGTARGYFKRRLDWATQGFAG